MLYISRFVRFKRFHFAKPFFFVFAFYFDVLDIKKRDLTVSTCLATFYSSGT